MYIFLHPYFHILDEDVDDDVDDDADDNKKYIFEYMDDIQMKYTHFIV